MDRRAFLTSWASRPESAYANSSSAFDRPRTLSAGLEPYVPSPAAPWNAIRAGHLLRRTTMLPRWQDITAVMAMTPGEAVDALLNTPSTPNPSQPATADRTTESLDGLDITTQNGIRSSWRQDAAILRAWYANVLTTSGLTLIEKMTMFWHGHFTSEFEVDLDFVLAPLLYRQNKLFRNIGLGNFRDLVFNMTLDGGMLVYLGGDKNNQKKPNENYARELMELYTMGLGHYTEGDVHEAARILTGWHTAQFHDKPTPNGIFNAYFTPADHDKGAKEFLGVTFSAIDDSTNTEFLVKKEEIQKLIDTIFLKRADETAKFVCRALYRFFVYSNPATADENVIGEMATIFKNNNFEIKPVLSALFKSAHFFDNANIGSQIKTPAELMFGFARQLELPEKIVNGNPVKITVPDGMSSTDQILFDPPNVSGWPGWHDWITTNNYPVRSTLAASAVTAMTEAKILTFIKQFPNYNDAGDLVDNMAALLLPRPLSVGRKQAFINILTNNGPGEYIWDQAISSSPSTAAGYMRNLLNTLITLPDFQLC